MQIGKTLHPPLKHFQLKPPHTHPIYNHLFVVYLGQEPFPFLLLLYTLMKGKVSDKHHLNRRHLS